MHYWYEPKQGSENPVCWIRSFGRLYQPASRNWSTEKRLCWWMAQSWLVSDTARLLKENRVENERKVIRPADFRHGQLNLFFGKLQTVMFLKSAIKSIFQGFWRIVQPFWHAWFVTQQTSLLIWLWGFLLIMSRFSRTVLQYTCIFLTDTSFKRWFYGREVGLKTDASYSTCFFSVVKSSLGCTRALRQ